MESSSKTKPAKLCPKCRAALFVMMPNWVIRCANCGKEQMFGWFDKDDGK